MNVQVLQGDALAVLSGLPDESVNCVVTSPPYLQQRDYGAAGQLGLEDTPELYVEALVTVFREVRRVLRSDGTCWCVLGDSFAGSWGNQGRKEERGTQRVINGPMLQNFAPYPQKQSNTGKVPSGLKPKDLMGVPWMVAFALRGDGWWLRSSVIWAKDNPMPESVKDRPTQSHEYVFLLTKSRRYFYNADAVKTPATESSLARIAQKNFDNQAGGPKDYAKGTNANRSMRKTLENWSDKQRGHSRRDDGFNGRWDAMSKDEQQSMGANLRSVWTIAPQNYREAHFATFPEKLVETCILAGCPEGGAVLDPFAGSGTTLAVAKRLGRSAIGIELNESYVELCYRRLAAITTPLALWSAGDESA